MGSYSPNFCQKKNELNSPLRSALKRSGNSANGRSANVKSVNHWKHVLLIFGGKKTMIGIEAAHPGMLEEVSQIYIF